jgi:hypothetical protein
MQEGLDEEHVGVGHGDEVVGEEVDEGALVVVVAHPAPQVALAHPDLERDLSLVLQEHIDEDVALRRSLYSGSVRISCLLSLGPCCGRAHKRRAYFPMLVAELHIPFSISRSFV